MDNQEMKNVSLESVSHADNQNIPAELLETAKKQNRLITVLLCVNAALVVVILAAVLVVVPKTTKLIDEAEAALARVQEISAQAEETLKNADALIGDVDVLVGDIDVMMKNVDVLVKDADKVLVDNTEGMNEAIANFNKMDFDSLNKAIQELAEVVEPLANLTYLFS
ncbi:MAG: hypothetical protein HUJ73_06210 [Eubacterium sp.]|nr:hypothetical protein [Eubacterium sp.]